MEENAKPRQSKEEDRAEDLARSRAFRKTVARTFFEGQFWFVLRNIIGWTLMLSTPIVGPLPGPGGLIVFVLGFAIASVPGKRKITAHVFRGRPVHIKPEIFLLGWTIFSILVVAGLLLVYRWKRTAILSFLGIPNDGTVNLIGLLVGVCVMAVVVCWVISRFTLLFINGLLRALPLARRTIRPWLAKRGIKLLPKRRRVVEGVLEEVNANEIIEFSPENQRAVLSFGSWVGRWLKRAFVIGTIAYIFYFIVTPVFEKWPATQEQLRTLSIPAIVVSSIIFAAVLAFLRAMVWRMTLKGMAAPIPKPAALRIWITSELMRYIPLMGGVVQFAGRVRLTKPYGVRGSVCSTSQVLELTAFMLANLIIALICWAWVGFRRFEGAAEWWAYVAALLVPALVALLHPAIFYTTANRVLKMVGKPPVVARVPFGKFVRLLVWSVVAVSLQVAAIWIMLQAPLNLSPGDIKVIGAAWCLAWVAGFLTPFAPGGLGVREAVLIGVFGVMLTSVDPALIEQTATIQAIALLLRLWTIVAELVVLGVAYLLDWRGATTAPTPLAPMPVNTDPLEHELKDDTVLRLHRENLELDGSGEPSTAKGPTP